MGLDGRMAPRTVAMDTFRWGSGGTLLGEWEHNNNADGTLNPNNDFKGIWYIKVW